MIATSAFSELFISSGIVSDDCYGLPTPAAAGGNVASKR